MVKYKRLWQSIMKFFLLVTVFVLSEEMVTEAKAGETTGTYPGVFFNLEEKGMNDILTGKQTSSIYLGEYEQDNKENGKEPVCWRVLENKNGNLFLLSDKNIDTMQYNQQAANVNWESCSLRNWLVNDFYTGAFTDAERMGILVTENEPSNNEIYGVKSERKTRDTVFLLSLEDIENAEYGFTDDASRMVLNTVYAGERGATGKALGDGFWWLRTPGRTAADALVVCFDGYYTDYGYPVEFVSIGVRPAFYFDTENVVMLMAERAEDELSKLRMEDTQFEKVPDSYEKRYTPVLFESGYELNIENVQPVKMLAGSGPDLEYSYALKLDSGAGLKDTYLYAFIEKVGENQEVWFDCIADITDQNDFNGETVITLPSDLGTGDYVLRIFGCRDNGIHKTKYASNVITVPIAVVTDMNVDKTSFFEEYLSDMSAVDQADKTKETIFSGMTGWQLGAYIGLSVIFLAFFAALGYAVIILKKNRK